MEVEKKKKKNKKRKNGQSKTTDMVAIGGGESTSADQNHVIEIEKSNHRQVSETKHVQNGIVQERDVDLGRHGINGTKGPTLAEAEKQYWLDREAILEMKIKQFQEERDAYMHEEASLKEKIKQLQEEKDAYIQKEVSLEDKINQLREDKDTHMKKEVSLEEKIKQLLKERDAHMQIEAGLEKKIKYLEKEKYAHMQKEASLEKKINEFMDELATVNFKGVSLEEKIKQMERERDSWVQKENSTKETIANLCGDNAQLQAQVMELEESRRSLLQENQRLTENLSGVQSHIQSLERKAASPHSSIESTPHASEDGEMNSQTVAAGALIDKLITENAELVEKVNELYVELDRMGVSSGPSSSVGSNRRVPILDSALVAENSAFRPDLMAGIAERPDNAADHIFEPDERMSSRMESLDSIMIDDVSNGGDYAAVIPDSLKTIETGEIVQIPLDANEVIELQAAHSGEKADLPLSDAPLIGAPFRLISFVARYVSGADLVDKSSSY